MMTDPIADMLTRIRNACRARHPEVVVPHSRIKAAVARVLEDEGFLAAVHEETGPDGHPVLRIELRYGEEGEPIVESIRRRSRPSRRVYVGRDAIPRVRNGLGVAVLSTSKGVLSDRQAREAGVGGELLCEVW